MPVPRNRHDTTSARRQRKRRFLFTRMRKALRLIEKEGDAKSQEMAREGLNESFDDTADKA